MHSHIYCNNCGGFKKVEIDNLQGDDVTGQFTGGADLVCSECCSVIATMADPKLKPSQGSSEGER